MQAVLISIQPQWVDKIFHQISELNGKPVYKKEDEARKSRPNTSVPFKVFIYESKRRKKVVGHFICDNISVPTHGDGVISENSRRKTALSPCEIADYAADGTVFFWHISDLKIYDKPRELSEFSKYGFGHPVPLKRPPQSWMYVEVEQ